jgi:hypothetical protein
VNSPDRAPAQGVVCEPTRPSINMSAGLTRSRLVARSIAAELHCLIGGGSQAISDDQCALATTSAANVAYEAKFSGTPPGRRRIVSGGQLPSPGGKNRLILATRITGQIWVSEGLHRKYRRSSKANKDMAARQVQNRATRWQ